MKLHFTETLIRESDLSRGRPLDLTVTFDRLMTDMQPISKTIVFGMKARLNGYWVPDAFVASFVDRAPDKFIGFASCDPTQPEYMEELKEGIEKLGLRGVKLGPIYAGIDPRDTRCEKVYAYCQNQSLPVMFHAGTTFNRQAPLAFSRPWLWDELAIKFPSLKMVLAHLGHPFCEECLVVIRKHPNLFADLSALYYRPWQFYNAMIAAQEYRVTHKILFGTDYPFTTPAESIQGLRNINHIAGNSGLPRVSNTSIEEILNRDSFELLGIKL
jgi:predicted TIM-barrel fold metal-dependent hydrolase